MTTTKWKASNAKEAADILKLLARQGEPLLKKLDSGIAVEYLRVTNDENFDSTEDNTSNEYDAASAG